MIARAPGWTAEARLELAARLDVVLRPTGARVLVHGDVEGAARRGLGLHLPEGGPEPRVARARLGPAATISAAVHDAARLDRVAEAELDLALISPVFATPSKPGARVLGPDGFGALARRAAERGAQLEPIALGGIRPGCWSSLSAQGARGVAAIRSAWDFSLLSDPELC